MEGSTSATQLKAWWNTSVLYVLQNTMVLQNLALKAREIFLEPGIVSRYRSPEHRAVQGTYGERQSLRYVVNRETLLSLKPNLSQSYF